MTLASLRQYETDTARSAGSNRRFAMMRFILILLVHVVRASVPHVQDILRSSTSLIRDTLRADETASACRALQAVLMLMLFFFLQLGLRVQQHMCRLCELVKARCAALTHAISQQHENDFACGS